MAIVHITTHEWKYKVVFNLLLVSFKKILKRNFKTEESQQISQYLVFAANWDYKQLK